MKIASTHDFRRKAKAKLPRFLFEYVDGGSYDEVTLHQNVEALQKIALRQRVLCDVSDIDLSTTLFGQKMALPAILAPVGLAGMYARRGEVQAAQAAEEFGIPFTLSTVSACPLKEVASKTKRPFWFQLYMIRDRAFMKDLLQQAMEAECNALVFTTDMPVPGARYRDYHSGLAGSAGVLGDMRRIFQAIQHPQWAWDVGVCGRPHQLGNVAPVLGNQTGLEDFFAWMRNNFDPSVTWEDIDFIRSIWKGPLIIKGILDKDDAIRAADFGADGLIVSNHGGRQLDGVPASCHALPAIAEAVGSRVTILADGGVRNGLDIVRMMALGANGVLLGRSWIYALAAEGKHGVSKMLDLFAAEMKVAMTLTGVTRPEQINQSILVNNNNNI